LAVNGTWTDAGETVVLTMATLSLFRRSVTVMVFTRPPTPPDSRSVSVVFNSNSADPAPHRSGGHVTSAIGDGGPVT
jgi:hypothetical protein